MTSGGDERRGARRDCTSALKGDRQGQYIRINEQWRICFEWPESSPGPVNVEIVDYH
jgi:plasmid maintenance system killer protein